MSGISAVFKLGGVLLTLFLIYVLVAGSITLVLYTRIGKGDPKGFWYTDRAKLKKYLFNSWIDWAGVPSTFSYLAANTATSYNLYKKVSNVTVNNCMLQCDGANSRGSTKCVGFMYDTSNTCQLVSSMDGITSMDATSNTVYFIDGLDTARQYSIYENKGQTDATYLAGSPYNIPDPLIPGMKKCLSNCVSISECTGVIMSSPSASTSQCALLKNMDPTKFTNATNSAAFYLQAHGPLTAAAKYY